VDKVIVDLEFTLTFPPRLVCVGLKQYGEAPRVHIIDHREGGSFGRLEYLKSFFAKYTGTIIGHNISSDLAVLLWYGIEINKKATIYDTGLAIKCINENETRWDLKTWATYLGFPPYWFYFHDHCENPGVAEMDLEELTKYNTMDLVATEALFNWCEERLTKQRHIHALECAMAPIVARSYQHGMAIDKKALDRHALRLDTEIAKIKQSILDKCGMINLRSPQQVARLLFDTLGLTEVSNNNLATC